MADESNIDSWFSRVRVHPHYARAPIKEAVIDIQLERSPSVTTAALEGLDTPSKKGYTQRRKVVTGEVQLTGVKETEELRAKTAQDHVGFQFLEPTRKHLLQLRVDRFTFSRLAPYQDWEQFRTEAKELWTPYRELVGQTPAMRIGLRYVNQLDLPVPFRDFRDFVRSYPEVSTDLPQGLAGFFMQVQIPLPDIDSMAILTETLVPPVRQDVVSLVLDIDVFKHPKGRSEEEIWSTLETFRERKNIVFEACITNRTRELIS